MLLTVGDRRAKTVALIDTGNLISSGLAISAAFARRNRLPFTPAPSNIGTARKGAKLNVLGHVRDVKLEVRGQVLGDALEATVIEDLSSDINVGAALLSRAGVVLSFNTTGAAMTLAGGRTMPLIQSLSGGDAQMQKPEHRQRPGAAAERTTRTEEEPEHRQRPGAAAERTTRTEEEAVMQNFSGLHNSKEPSRLTGAATHVQ